MISIAVLDTAVPARDLSENDLRKGDSCAVVERYEPDGAEVEFVAAPRKTQAPVTLKLRNLRLVGDKDMPAARPLDAA